MENELENVKWRAFPSRDPTIRIAGRLKQPATYKPERDFAKEISRFLFFSLFRFLKRCPLPHGPRSAPSGSVSAPPRARRESRARSGGDHHAGHHQDHPGESQHGRGPCMNAADLGENQPAPILAPRPAPRTKTKNQVCYREAPGPNHKPARCAPRPSAGKSNGMHLNHEQNESYEWESSLLAIAPRSRRDCRP